MEAFAAVEEPGAEALVGSTNEAVIPEGGDVMFYGDGGAGKTTLAVDLACHLAAGEDWLGLRVARPARILLIENEGPRPLFRAKLRRKLEAWSGAPLGGRVSVFAQPWGKFSFADRGWRKQIAVTARDQAIDVLIVGPLSGAGMNEAGNLQEVRDFMALVNDVREQSGRHLVVVLIHHEAKGGKVSGAWEGSGDTLFHVLAQGRGKLRLYFQKARWSSAHHATTLQLAWADGEGFTVQETPERDDNAIAAELLEAVRANGGASWNAIEKKVGGKGERKRVVRDRLLAGGRMFDNGGKSGMKLWHADDPARPILQELRPDAGAAGKHLSEEPPS